MTNQNLNDKSKKFDLEDRTAVFAENVIDYCKKIPKNSVTAPIISQLIRSGTSIGANYCEADCAETKKDFEHKMGISRKESKETKFWLRMIARTVPDLKDEAKILWKETNELNLIFSSIINKSRMKK